MQKDEGMKALGKIRFECDGCKITDWHAVLVDRSDRIRYVCPACGRVSGRNAPAETRQADEELGRSIF